MTSTCHRAAKAHEPGDALAVPRPPEAEVRDPVVLGASPSHVPVAGQRLQHAARRGIDHREQEPDPRRRGSGQLAALGPPQLHAVVQVRLAVPQVTAAHRGLPEPAGELLAAQVAPALVDVALVAALVDDHRLAVRLPPFGRVLRGAVRIDPLDAAMGDPRAGVVVETVAVVDRGEVAHVVAAAEDLGQVLPVLGRLPRQQVVLVGQRPPDGAMRAQPPGEVPHVPVVGRLRHLREAPPVVGVEQDEVGLDPQLGELPDARLQVPEEPRVEPREVPLAFAVAGANG